MGVAEFLALFGCPTRKSPMVEEISKKTVKDFKEAVSHDPKPKRTVRKFQEKSTLSRDAEEFRPSQPAVDPSEPEWAQFLAKKAHETRSRDSPAAVPKRSWVKGPTGQLKAAEQPKASPANFTLQTSEYLKLLKGSDPKESNDRRSRPSDNKPPGLDASDVTTESLKLDLAGALDSIIRSQRAGQMDPRKKTTPLKRVIMQERMERGTGKDDALWRIAQMLEPKDEADAQEVDVSQMITSRDDLGVEMQNRDEDLAELAYWSEDDQAPRAIRRASAHKVGNLPLDNRTVREYVTQKVGPDLDSKVATLLLHLRRLNDRHRSLEPEVAPRRRFVVGIKEVFRGVRNSKVKCIVLAPDIEEISKAGGLDDRIKDILRVAYEQDVPVIFALSRIRIGRALNKSLRMSVLAILDVKGVNDLFDSTIELAYQKRIAWLNEQPKPKLAAAPAGKTTPQATKSPAGKKSDAPWAKADAPWAKGKGKARAY